MPGNAFGGSRGRRVIRALSLTGTMGMLLTLSPPGLSQATLACPQTNPNPIPTPNGSAGPSSSPSGSPSPLTLLPSPKDVSFAFSYNRDSQCKTIEVDASQSIPRGATLSVIPLGDLTPSEGNRSLPYWVISGMATSDPTDPTLVRLTVKVDLSKAGALEAGAYAGGVRILGTGITSLTVPVSVSLKSSWWWLAFLVLILGLGVGYIFKLNTGIGAKFRPLQRRYENIRRQYVWLAEHPSELEVSYRNLEAAIASWDLDAASAEADAIEKSLAAFVRLQPIFARARSEIAAQGAAAAAFPDVSRLMDLETRKLDEAVDDTWPDPTAKEGAARTLLTQITFVGYMLRDDPVAFEPALRLFLQDRFDEGTTKGKEIADAGGKGSVVTGALAAAAPGQLAPNSPPTVAGRPAARSLRRGRLRTTSKAFLYERVLPPIVGVATTAIIVAVGFETQYINKPTFGFGGFGDWLALFVWGFVAGLSGKAVTEYTQQISGAAAV